MYNKTLVPLDGSELAECVLPHVESIAGGCGAKNVTFYPRCRAVLRSRIRLRFRGGRHCPEEVDAENKTQTKKIWIK
jgi:hypothetical protein